VFEILFDEVKTGRLQRLPFLGYSLLIQLLFFGFIFAIVVAIGAGEHLIGGDLQQAQKILTEWFFTPFFIIFGLFMLLISFTGLNLVAKRIRDAGLPGWWTLLAIFILEVLISTIISQEASGSLHILFIVILLFIPSDTFSNSEITG
jgi:uncharacterized membrane protein YhaH (DUF805 family)